MRQAPGWLLLAGPLASALLVVTLANAVLADRTEASSDPAGEVAPQASPVTPVSAPDELIRLTESIPPVESIPRVQGPRKLAGTSPCELLTPEQLAANRIDQPGQPKSVLSAPGCVWGDSAHARRIAVFEYIGTNALENMMVVRASYAVFEITQVAGHPAIRTKDKVDAPHCFVHVAAAEKQTVAVQVTSLGQDSEDPCGPAAQLAATVIGNLPVQD